MLSTCFGLDLEMHIQKAIKLHSEMHIYVHVKLTKLNVRKSSPFEFTAQFSHSLTIIQY